MRRTSDHRVLADRIDSAACRALLRDGSRSFFAASLVLPGSVREPATALYAFCRVADDAVDEGGDRHAAVEDLRRRLNLIYAGTPADIAADRAFADVVAHYAIPRRFPEALLEGFAWDAEHRRYADLDALIGYAVRVAGTVGAMLAMVMGVRDAQLLARACDLGVAMQLTNVARDVGEDARCGRLYLPVDWMRRAGLDPQAWLRAPTFDSRLAGLVADLLAAADRLYRRADEGIARLPMNCRPGMHAARLLYSEIGREIERQGYDTVNRRAVVGWRRKARVLGDGVLAAARGAARPCAEGPLPQAGFLFEAPLDSQPSPSGLAPADLPSARERARWPGIQDRMVWLIGLFERLERLERLARAQSPGHPERQQILHPASAEAIER